MVHVEYRSNHDSVTRYIVGYKKEESDFLLKFLYDHIAFSQDVQTRVRWRPGTVVVWDVSSCLNINDNRKMLTTSEPSGFSFSHFRLGGWTETSYRQNYATGRASI